MMKLAIVLITLFSIVACDPIIGAEEDIQRPDAQEYDLAAWAVHQVNAMSNYAGKLTLMEVTNVKKQIVAGNKYTFTGIYSSSSLLTNQFLLFDLCSLIDVKSMFWMFQACSAQNIRLKLVQ
jgi:hypothetical protein